MDIDDVEEDYTPLCRAIAFDRMGYARTFLKMGANPNQPDDEGLTALSFCETYRQVKFLVKSGADVNYQDKRTRVTPLYYTTYHGNLEAIRALLDYGADMYCQCIPRGKECKDSIVYTAPFVALCEYEPWHRKILQLYKEYGYNMDGVDGDGSLLHACILKGNIFAIEWLARQKVNVKIKNMHGRTALEEIEYLFQTNEWAILGYSYDSLREMQKLLRK
jgi:ankyrin repeat protein